MKLGSIMVLLMSLVFPFSASAQTCVDCHKKITPEIVSDWQLSKRSQNDTEIKTMSEELRRVKQIEE